MSTIESILSVEQTKSASPHRSFANGADILLDIADEKHCHPARLVVLEKISEIPTVSTQNAFATNR